MRRLRLPGHPATRSSTTTGPRSTTPDGGRQRLGRTLELLPRRRLARRTARRGGRPRARAADLADLDGGVADCFACPRLVAWREEVAADQAGRLPRPGVLGPPGARLRRGRRAHRSSSGWPRPRTAATAPAASSPATAPATCSSPRCTGPAWPTSRTSVSVDDGLRAARHAHRRRGALRAAGQQAHPGRARHLRAVAAPRGRTDQTHAAGGGRAGRVRLGRVVAGLVRGVRRHARPCPRPAFGHGAALDAAPARRRCSARTTSASRTPLPDGSHRRCSTTSSTAPSSSPGSPEADLPPMWCFLASG